MVMLFTGQVERDFARRSSKIPSLEDIQETLSQVDMIYCSARPPLHKRHCRTYTSVFSCFAGMVISQTILRFHFFLKIG